MSGTRDKTIPITADGLKKLMDSAAANGGDVRKALADLAAPSPIDENAPAGLKPRRLCQRKGCLQHAIGALTISIPYPSVNQIKLPSGEERKDEFEPTSFFVGAELCQQHIDAFSVADFLTPGLQMQFARRLIAAGFPRPLFEKAWANAVAIDDPKWLEYKAGIAAAQQAAPEPLN